jgi:hypothetical protein
MNTDIIYSILSYAPLREQIIGYMDHPNVRPFFDGNVKLWAVNKREIMTLMKEGNIEYLSFLIQRMPIIGAEGITTEIEHPYIGKTDIDLIEYMILYGSLSDIRDIIKYNVPLSHPISALRYAVQRNDRDIISLVLKNAVEIYSDDDELWDEFRDILDNAIFKNQCVVVELLGSYFLKNRYNPSDNRNPISTAVMSRSKCIDILVKVGFDINASMATYDTPLAAAIRMKDPSMVNHILSLGADPNAMLEQDYPLTYAMAYPNIDIIRAIVNAGGKGDYTTLITARDYPEIFEYLLESGVIPDNDILLVYNNNIVNSNKYYSLAPIVERYLHPLSSVSRGDMSPRSETYLDL